MTPANCSTDEAKRNLWLAFPGNVVSMKLRRRTGGKLPDTITALNGRTLPLQDVLALLPPLSAVDFQNRSQNMPELRADVGEWCISIFVAGQDTGPNGKADAIEAMSDWVGQQFATPGATG